MLELCTAKPSKAPDAPGPLLRCPGGGPKEPRTPESKEWNILTEEAQSEPHWAARRPLQSDRGIRVRQWGEREGGKVRFNRSNSKYKHACLVAQSCPTLLRPQGLQPIRLHCPWDIPGKITRVGHHSLPDLGIKHTSLASPAFAGRFFIISATWGAHYGIRYVSYYYS